MESITIYPDNERQKSLIQSLLEELKIRFEVGQASEKTAYTQEEFTAKIDRAIQQAELGQTRVVSKDDQKALLGL